MSVVLDRPASVCPECKVPLPESLSVGDPCPACLARAAVYDSVRSPGVMRAFGLLIGVGAIALGIASVLYADPPARILLVLAGLGGLFGYRRGSAGLVALVLGLFAAYFAAPPLGRAIEPWISNLVGTGGITGRALSIGAAGIVLMMVVSVLVKRSVRSYLVARPELAQADRWFGCALGTAEGVLLGLSIMWGVLAIEPIAAARISATTPATYQNELARQLLNAADTIRGGQVGMIAASANPIAQTRPLAVARKWVQIVNNPQLQSRFAQQPQIAGLSARPAVAETLRRIEANPELHAIFAGENGFDPQVLQQLLASEELLQILDETKLMDDLLPMMGDVEKALDDTLAEPVKG